jgi:hypothetical protein
MSEEQHAVTLADALHTHHADSLISCTLPADGAYFVRLGDAQHQGGPECAYRLRISPPRPDLRLLISASFQSAPTASVSRSS